MSSYWDHKGEEQKEHERLWDKYIPAKGASEYLETELFRASNRLQYDYYNNGWGCNNKTPELHFLQTFGFYEDVKDDDLIAGMDCVKHSKLLEKYMADEHTLVIRKVVEHEKNNTLTPVAGDPLDEYGLDCGEWNELIDEYYGEDDDEDEW